MDTTPEPDGPVLRQSRVVRWFAERPRIADVLVMLACAIPTVAALVLAPPPHAWLGYVCAAGVAIAFWWRRSSPLIVLLVVVALATLNPVSAPAVTPAFFESAFALYALASRARIRTVLLGYALSLATMFACAGLTVLLGFREQLPFAVVQPASLIAIALGIAARAGRLRRAAVEELVTMREARAAAAERARITAEMHDVVAHSVTVMVALAGGAAAGWEKHPERARQALDELSGVGAQALYEMQRILRVLREENVRLDRDLEASGLNLPSLDELVELFRLAGLPVALVVNPDEIARRAGAADPALDTTVYRIVQEALTNVLRHACDSTYVEVALACDNEHLTISVTDNGTGAATATVPSVGAGVGLLAMRERASVFGGELRAGPVPSRADAPGRGWRTEVSIPLREGVS